MCVFCLSSKILAFETSVYVNNCKNNVATFRSHVCLGSLISGEPFCEVRSLDRLQVKAVYLSYSHRRLLDPTDTWRTTRRWWSVRLIGQAGKETALYLCTFVEIFRDVTEYCILPYKSYTAFLFILYLFYLNVHVERRAGNGRKWSRR